MVARRAVGQLLHEPNQLGLTRAFVAGDLRYDGPLEDILAQRNDFGGIRPTARELLRQPRGRPCSPPRRAAAAPRSRQRTAAAGRRHSQGRDRVAVRHHYDVSNDFYRRLLGPSLVYSCAYFADPGESLEAAQERKLELICRKLRLRAGDRLLDIGCGWGSLAAARRRPTMGCGRGITCRSPSRARPDTVREAGLSDRCEIRVADYREISDGPYDKIASVGMMSTSARNSSMPTPGRSPDCSVQAASYSTTASRGSAQTGRRQIVDPALVFPDGELPPVAGSSRRCRRPGSRPATSSPCASTTG